MLAGDVGVEGRERWEDSLTCEDVEQGGLARARGPEDGEEAPRFGVACHLFWWGGWGGWGGEVKMGVVGREYVPG